MKKSGLFIVNEGTDGSGKATQTELLVARLRREGFPIATVAFPRYAHNAVAELIRIMLRDRREEWLSWPWESKAILYASDRRAAAAQIRQWLSKDMVVVADRYTPTNMAHMAATAEDPRQWQEIFEWIYTFEFGSAAGQLALPLHDVVLLHHMPEDVRRDLLRQREGGAGDAHEADLAYQRRVVACFSEMKRLYGNIHEVNAAPEGILLPPEEVHEHAWRILTESAPWQEYCANRQAVRVS